MPEPTLVAAGTLFAAASGTAITPVMPANTWEDGDIILMQVMTNLAATFTTPTGYGPFGTAINSANQSTAWFWKRHVGAGGSEGNPSSTSSSTGSTTNGLYGRCYIWRGCIKTGDPFEGVANNGTPTTTNAPQSNAVTTTGPDRTVVSLVSVDDDNTWSSGMPPATYTSIASVVSTTGGDAMFAGIYKTQATADTVAAVTLGTMSAADYWRTCTFALIPEPPPPVAEFDVTPLTSGISTSNPATTALVTPTEDATLLLTISISNSGAPYPADALTVSGCGAEWSQVGTAGWASRRRIYLWQGKGAVAAEGAVTITQTNGTPQEIGWGLSEGVYLDETTPVSGFVATVDDGAVTSRSATASGTPDSGDGTYSGMALESNINATPSASFVGLNETTTGTLGVRRVETAWSEGAAVSCTWTWDGSAQGSAVFTVILNKGTAPPAGGTTKIQHKASGAMSARPVMHKSGGAFTARPIRRKIGGVWLG